MPPDNDFYGYEREDYGWCGCLIVAAVIAFLVLTSIALG